MTIDIQQLVVDLERLSSTLGKIHINDLRVFQPDQGVFETQYGDVRARLDALLIECNTLVDAVLAQARPEIPAKTFTVTYAEQVAASSPQEAAALLKERLARQQYIEGKASVDFTVDGDMVSIALPAPAPTE